MAASNVPVKEWLEGCGIADVDEALEALSDLLGDDLHMKVRLYSPYPSPQPPALALPNPRQSLLTGARTGRIWRPASWTTRIWPR